MNLAVIGTVFAVIFIGELPDKTMVASLVMSTKGRPFAVWLGAAGAFMVHVLIATTLGTVVFHLLAPQVVDAVVAVIFLAGAGLAVADAIRERRRKEQPEPPPVPPSRPGRTAATAFAVIFAAEWGDLTQLPRTTTHRYRSRPVRSWPCGRSPRSPSPAAGGWAGSSTRSSSGW